MILFSFPQNVILLYRILEQLPLTNNLLISIAVTASIVVFAIKTPPKADVGSQAKTAT
jgi:hypothetical protein